MLAVTHPEVLSIDWLPPTLLGRGMALSQAERSLAVDPGDGRTRLLAIEGPEGAGTSSVARCAARRWMERHSSRASPTDFRILAVRARPSRGSTSVAGDLLRKFDPGFDPRGFPTMEILAGCLRRLKREGKPAAIVLDDIEAGAPPLADIVRGLSCPGRFLPEGEESLPPLTVILAGRPDSMDRISRGTRINLPRLALAPYTLSELRAIVADRIARALAREPPAGMAERIAQEAHTEGRGAARALDLLRRELIGGSVSRPSSVVRTLEGDRGLLIEEHLVRAIAGAVRSGVSPLGRVRSWEQRVAQESGVASLPPSTFWRRIVRLEQAGYLRREVRTGGTGGTQSRLYLLLPVDRWVTIPRARGTPRASAPTFGGTRGPEVGVSAPSA